jgi:hypothetical protein
MRTYIVPGTLQICVLLLTLSPLLGCGLLESDGAGADRAPADHPPIVSTELVDAKFHLGVTREQVDAVAMANRLVVARKRYSGNESRNAYVLKVDRTVASASFTATEAARALLWRYPDLVESAEPQVYYYVIE